MTAGLALGLLAASCAHGGGAGPYGGWSTVTTTHFDIHTPLSAEVAEDVAWRLEAIHSAFSEAFFAGAQLRSTVEVLVFRDQRDERAAVEQAKGTATEKRPEGGILVLGEREGRVDQTGGLGKFSTPWQLKAARDLAGRFIRQGLGRAPEWFQVGLERYLETIQIEPDQARFGRRHPDMVVELARGKVVPVGELIAMSREEWRGEWRRSHEATAWGFVHFMLHGEEGHLRPSFDALAAVLRDHRGDPAAVRASLDRALPGVSFPELETRARDYQVNVLGREHAFHGFELTLKAPVTTRGTAVPAASGHVASLLLVLKPRR
jgi:hypothetical protein